MVVLGSDQGLCGTFNEQVVSLARAEMDRLAGERHDVVVLVMGERAANLLLAAGRPVSELLRVPGSAAAIGTLVSDLFLKLEVLGAGRELALIQVLFNRPVSGAGFRPRFDHPLPLPR